MLQNGTFSEEWETLPAIKEANYLRNQRPNGWDLSWVTMGEPIYGDSNAISGGIPECVHKLSTQLPPNEQLGKKDALILAGTAVYKIFNGFAPFGASLTQTVTGLQPGAQATLTVPIQVHLHGETDAYGAESGVWVNGEGGWVHGFDMGDRRWYEHEITFTVPESGTADIVIRVKSKWPKGKDFFIDGITLAAETAVTPPPPDEHTGPIKTVFIQVPAGVEVKQGTSSQVNTIEVNVGPGMKVEIV